MTKQEILKKANELIIDIEKAKAFFGEEYNFGFSFLTKKPDKKGAHELGKRLGMPPDWQHYLQLLVILPDDERIKYLKKFL